MDLDHPVVESSCGLERGVDVVLRPGPRIEQHRSQRRTDGEGVDADVLVGTAIRARPGPNLAEEASVEGSDERIVEHDQPALSRDPRKALFDVGLFELVELTAGGDVA